MVLFPYALLASFLSLRKEAGSGTSNVAYKGRGVEDLGVGPVMWSTKMT